MSNLNVLEIKGNVIATSYEFHIGLIKSIFKRMNFDSISDEILTAISYFIDSTIDRFSSSIANQKNKNNEQQSETLFNYNTLFVLVMYFARSGKLNNNLLKGWAQQLLKSYSSFIMAIDLPTVAKKDSLLHCFNFVKTLSDVYVDLTMIIEYYLDSLYINTSDDIELIYYIIRFLEKTEGNVLKNKIKAMLISKIVEVILSHNTDIEAWRLFFVHPLLIGYHLNAVKNSILINNGRLKRFEEVQKMTKVQDYTSFFNKSLLPQFESSQREKHLTSMIFYLQRAVDNEHMINELNFNDISEYIINKITRNPECFKLGIVLYGKLINKQTCENSIFTKNTLFIISVGCSLNLENDQILIFGQVVGWLAKYLENENWDNLTQKLFDILVDNKKAGSQGKASSVKILLSMLTFIYYYVDNKKAFALQDIFINTIIKASRMSDEWGLFLSSTALLYCYANQSHIFPEVMDKTFLFIYSALITNEIEDILTINGLKFVIDILNQEGDYTSTQMNILENLYGLKGLEKKQKINLSEQQHEQLSMCSEILGFLSSRNRNYVSNIYEPTCLFLVFLKSLKFNRENTTGILRLIKVTELLWNSKTNSILSGYEQGFAADPIAILKLINFKLIYSDDKNIDELTCVYNFLNTKSESQNSFETILHEFEELSTNNDRVFEPYIHDKTLFLLAEELIRQFERENFAPSTSKDVLAISARMFSVIVLLSSKTNQAFRRQVSNLLLNFTKKFSSFDNKGNHDMATTEDSLTVNFSAQLESIMR